MLKSWAERGLAHSGVIFVDDRTIAQRNVGGLVRSLAELDGRESEADWRNRVVYLKRAVR